MAIGGALRRRARQIRRAGAAASLVLTMLAPAARADVLVPADPPAQAAETVASAGDVVVLNRGRKVSARVSGKAMRVPGTSATTVVADDGTAVIASLTSKGVFARVRRGGTFAPAVQLGGRARFVRVDVARGGWVAVAWTDTKMTDIQLAVIEPSGQVVYQVLERAEGQRLSMPAVGIDANGRTTVAWSRWRDAWDDHDAGPQEIRVARGYEPATTVASGAAALYEKPTWPIVALAVADSGRSLLAWATLEEVRVSEDGGPPQTLASAGQPSSPTVALAGSGAAVVAYSDIDAGRLPVLAVDRRAGGGWTQPHRLSGRFISVTAESTVANDEDVELSSAIGEDGRAAVGWVALDDTHRDDWSRPAVIAAGSAGGRWKRARAVSPPTATVQFTPALFLDAAGAPRALWAETPLLVLAGRVHGVRLAPAAQAPPRDATPPRLTATLPARIRLERVRIPVSCSEPCQIQAQLWDDPADRADALIELPAGRPSTLTLTPPDLLRYQWEGANEGTVRLRLRVRASDRAGNVSTLTRTVRGTIG